MADAMGKLVIDDMREDIDDDTLDMSMGDMIDDVLGEDADISSDYPEDDEEEIDTYHLENFKDDYLERDPLPRII